MSPDELAAIRQRAEKTTKTCCRCDQDKSVADFYADKRAKDGLSGHCKQCHLAKTNAYKRADPERRRLQDQRWRQQNPDAVQAARRRYWDANPGLKTEHNRDWRRRYPDRARAHNALNRAVRLGIVRPPHCCQSCGREAPLEAHHADYSKPLEVSWLCRKCHANLGPQ